MLDDNTIHGFFAFVFLASVPVAALLGVFVRRRYRTAITRAMLRASDAPESAFDVPEAPHPNATELRFDTTKLTRRTVPRWDLAWRYLLSGLAFAIVTTVTLLILNGFAFNPLRVGVLIATFAFPALVMALYVAGLRLGLIVLAAGLWLGALALVTPDSLAVLGLLVGPALLLAFLVGNPALRTTAVPLFLVAVAFVVSLTFSLNVILALAQTNVLNDLYLILPGAVVNTLYYLMGIALCLGAGAALALGAARLVARLTARSSEFMMQHDLLWLFQCLWLMNLGSTDAGTGVLAYLLAFVAYRGVLRALRPMEAAREVNLLLRVFGQSDTQRSLARNLLLDWRREGPVLLIGAEDLATETLDASELAAFLSGRLASIFIETPGDLARLDAAGTPRLGDGLFPMQDFYCRDNSWRPTVLTMMSRARRVLIDMRGFDPANAGIRFEIAALAARVPAERITIVAEASRGAAVEALFTQAWAEAGRPAPPDRIALLLA